MKPPQHQKKAWMTSSERNAKDERYSSLDCEGEARFQHNNDNLHPLRHLSYSVCISAKLPNNLSAY